ncbi:MAG: hypothetical protein AB7P03_05120 [Kofleriaceae bacterium]
MSRLVALALTVALAAMLGGERAHAQRQPGWELRVPERLELAAGASGQLEMSIAVDRGLTVSKDGPVMIDLAPDPAITIKKHRLGRRDAVDPGADAPRFAIPMRVQPTGDYSLKLRVRFWLCGSKVCRPIDTQRTVTVSAR